MRVLIINHEFPPIGGGGAIACGYLADYLAGVHERVVVVTSAFGALPKEEARGGCVIRRIYAGRRYAYTGRIGEYVLFILSGFLFFLREIYTIRPNITYVFFTLPSGLLGLFLKKTFAIPYIIFLRGIDVPGFYGGHYSFLNRFFRPLIKYIWLNAETIIANSRSLQTLAFNTCREKPIHVIPNGVDTDEFHPPQRSRGKGHNGTLRIIFVGRLDKQKCLDVLLEAVAQAAPVLGNRLSVVLIGDGPEKNKLIARAIQLVIADKVVFSGWQKRDALLKEYNNADVFVSCSAAEGMSNAMLEALACGLPIVASDIPAHRELIEEGRNGLLVPPYNPSALAGALTVLGLDASLKERMAQENARKVKDYDWRTLYARLEGLGSG